MLAAVVNGVANAVQFSQWFGGTHEEGRHPLATLAAALVALGAFTYGLWHAQARPMRKTPE